MSNTLTTPKVITEINVVFKSILTRSRYPLTHAGDMGYNPTKNHKLRRLQGAAMSSEMVEAPDGEVDQSAPKRPARHSACARVYEWLVVAWRADQPNTNPPVGLRCCGASALSGGPSLNS